MAMELVHWTHAEVVCMYGVPPSFSQCFRNAKNSAMDYAHGLLKVMQPGRKREKKLTYNKRIGGRAEPSIMVFPRTYIVDRRSQCLTWRAG